MEVHHHAHSSASPGHRKKWTHYFWEFLMLFLAVFCGFLAENKREHMVEHQREKRFARALYEDLQTDTAELQLSVRSIDSFFITTDHFFAELKKPRSRQSDSVLQVTGAGHIYDFNFFDATMGNYDQIKNAGALRYFKQDLVKKLTIYETGAKKLTQEKQNYIEFLNSVIIPFCSKIANAGFLQATAQHQYYGKASVFISSPNEELLNQWENYTLRLRQKQAAHKWAIERHRGRAVALLLELANVYHLK